MNPVFENFQAILERVAESQAGAIRAAGALMANCMAEDGLVYVFGSGHSHILAEELFYRAGGPLNICPILDSGIMLHESALTSSTIERLEGYAAALLDRYNPGLHDMLIVASNSGRNAAPVEMALEAHRRGMPVVALTSMSHTLSVSPRNSSGKRLFEVADVVLDNCGELGDASLEVEGLAGKIAPTSTVVGVTILHAIVYEAVTQLLQRGIRPTILHSANIDEKGGNLDTLDPYRARVRHL